MAAPLKQDTTSSALSSPTIASKTLRDDTSHSPQSRRNIVFKESPESVGLPAQDTAKAQPFPSTFIIDRKARALKLAAKSGAQLPPDTDPTDPPKVDSQSHRSDKIFLDSTLEEELSESYLLDVPGFIEHLFPDKILPLSFESLRFIVMTHHWDERSNAWKDTDPASATFFNRLNKTLIETACTFNRDFELPSDRTWVSECDLPLRSTENDGKRKPGLSLVNTGGDATWASTLVNVERKPKASDVVDALTQLTNGARMIFSTQEQRRFYIGISICDTDIRVYVFDRAGVVGSMKFHIMKDPHLLIRLIAGLTLTDGASIGFDSSIQRKEDGTKYVTVAGLEYNLLTRLSVSGDLRGRGTVVWKAERDGINYVIKDTWTDTPNSESEAGIMRMAGSVEGVVHLVAEEIVQHYGQDDSTANIRSIVEYLPDYCHRDWYKCLEVLRHTRIVITPCAQPLATFKSKKELLMAFIDVIEAHRRLVEKNIMHCDISMNNVMLYRPTTPLAGSKTEDEIGISTNLRTNDSVKPTMPATLLSPQVVTHRARGILIDLDNAVITHDDKGNKKENTKYCQGTVPFAATEVLMGLRPGDDHQAHHDLESFFYLLLCITLQYSGPNNTKRTDVQIGKDGQIKHWLEGRDMQELGEAKYTTMTTTPVHFYRVVTRKCTPYFKDLIFCLEELRQKIFFGEGDRRPTHQDIIDILRKPLQWLPDVDIAPSRSEVPVVRRPLKRMLDRVEDVEPAVPSAKRIRILSIP